MNEYHIIPVPKPRMTQSDKWKRRPCTTKYWQYKDDVKRLGIKVPESGAHVVFCIPMPKSWSKKRKAEKVSTPHQTKPDLDNLLKALLDAIYEDDSGVYDIRVSKVWSTIGTIIIEEYGDVLSKV